MEEDEAVQRGAGKFLDVLSGYDRGSTAPERPLRRSHQSPLARPSWATTAALDLRLGQLYTKVK